MTITLDLSPQSEARLRELAAHTGTTVEEYAKRLLESCTVGFGGGAQLPPDEFRRQLQALWEGLPPLPTLPPDFSRADIYADHD